VKSSYDEEWSYSPNGELVCQTFGDQQNKQLQSKQKVVYLWDGETLRPKEGSPSFGVGRWNGVWLAWYQTTRREGDKDKGASEEGDGVDASGLGQQQQQQEEPLFRYFWVPGEREFQTHNLQLTWKWTRHFLASKFGTGEWILEGEVPNPVVMCLQLMRYASLADQH